MSYNNEKLEEFERYIKGKKIAIIGLGISNIPLLSYLYSLECTVSVFDKREIEKLDSKAVKEIKQYNFNLYCGPDSMKNLKNFDVIFRSPSCRPDTKEILEEVQNGAVLTSEIEMLMQTCPATIIGITGSDGKTTTTNLIYHILKESGYNCYLGGNIGIPLFTKVKEMKKEDKKVVLILVGIAVIVVGCLCIFGNMGKKQSDNEDNEAKTSEKSNSEKYVQKLEDGSKLNVSDKLRKSKTVDGLEISNIQLKEIGGITTLLADVENKTGVATAQKIVKIEILDNSGKVLTDVQGIIDPMKVGEKVQLNVAVSADVANAYDFRINGK